MQDIRELQSIMKEDEEKMRPRKHESSLGMALCPEAVCGVYSTPVVKE
jgi:hypothetical protein